QKERSGVGVPPPHLPLEGAALGRDAPATEGPLDEDKLRRKLAIPTQGRLYYIRYALKMGWTNEQIYQLTKIDRWFLAEMKQLVDFENELATASALVKPTLREQAPPNEVASATAKLGANYYSFKTLLRQAKQWGFSDVQLGQVFGLTPSNL